MTAPISEVPEALKLLNELAERGQDWKNDCAEPWGNWINDVGEEDLKLLTAAFALVPAMVKVARAVLEKRRVAKMHADTIRENVKTGREKATPWQIREVAILDGIDEAIISDAESYRPAMVELGWWPK